MTDVMEGDSWMVVPVSASVMVTLYSLMTPLCSSTTGGSQDM